MVIEDLKKLGLSQNEAEVYVQLVQLGQGKAADLIRQTGLHRNLVYQALEHLTDRHLATKLTRGGVFHFQAADTHHLHDTLHEQGLVADRVIESLKERVKFSEQEITIYEGEDAIRSFSLKSASSLSPGKYIHVLGSGGKHFEEAMGSKALKKYDSDIMKRGGIRVLMYRSQPISLERQQTLRAQRYGEIRILPFDGAPSANVVFTDTSVAFLIFEKPYTVIEIRNPHLVATYKNYFEMLWRQDVRVRAGTTAIEDAFYEMIDSLEPGEEYYVLGGNLGHEYEQRSAMFDRIHNHRIKRGVIANILAQHDAALNIRERNRRAGDPEEKVSRVKSFQTPFLSPMQINMFKDKAFMVLYKEEPTVVYFDDPEIARGFKLYFDEIWNRQTETLHGYEGIITLCERVLEEGKDLYLIAATGNIIRTHREYYQDFTRRRAEKNIHLHILANEETRGGPIMNLPLTSGKFLPKAFASPMVIWIFGDYVAHVLWHEPETIFLMHNSETASYYRQYYAALEKIAIT